MDAILKKHGPQYVLMVERQLGHPAEKVWSVVTEREQLKQWFPCDVEGEWKVGAELRFNFLHGEDEELLEEDLHGEVIAVDEPRLLEFRWGQHYLKYELVPDGDGCLFRLSERFEDPSWGARNAAGWEMCLESLQLVVEGAAVAKFAADIWKKKFQHYVQKFEPEFGPQEDPSEDPEKHPLLKEDAAAE